LKALRNTMRRRRAALPPAVVAEHSRQVAQRLWREPALARASRIACYLAIGGEVDCAPLMADAHERGRSIYLPVLRGNALVFLPWSPGAPLVANRFGIPEPADDGHRALRGPDLDVVLAPLVAFDPAGNRLGMGGGYYDRSFAFRRHRGAWRRPRFIGLAHAFQRVESLPRQRWDVPLDAAITEQATHHFTHARGS